MTCLEAGVMLPARRQELYNHIHNLHEAGYSIRKISQTIHCSRTTVYKYLNGEFLSICATELTSVVDEYRDVIVKALAQGICRSNIYRELQKQGLHCGKTAAYDYMNRLAAVYGIELSRQRDCSPQQKEQAKQIAKYDYISRKAVFRYLWMGEKLSPHHLSYLYETYPVLRILYSCIKEFRHIFKTEHQSELYSFVDKYRRSDLKQLCNFITGLEKDLEAVENAVSSPLSNGFVEGTNSKLKMVKRTMYGRCGRLLLEAKLMLVV